MNNISIIFDGGNSISSASSIACDTLTTTSSYITDINHKNPTTVSIVFDGGTSISNYVFGPSFDCGNSADNIGTDTMSRRASNLYAFDEISESSESIFSGSCPENVFIFDGGNSRSTFGSLEYEY
jgi:hypothetical protein